MRIKQGFELRDVCGEKVIVAEGIHNIDFSQIISLNESAAFLWENLPHDKNFTVQDMVQLLLEEYDVLKHIALADSEELLASWLSVGIVEE